MEVYVDLSYEYRIVRWWLGTEVKQRTRDNVRGNRSSWRSPTIADEHEVSRRAKKMAEPASLVVLSPAMISRRLRITGLSQPMRGILRSRFLVRTGIVVGALSVRMGPNLGFDGWWRQFTWRFHFLSLHFATDDRCCLSVRAGISICVLSLAHKAQWMMLRNFHILTVWSLLYCVRPRWWRQVI